MVGRKDWQNMMKAETPQLRARAGHVIISLLWIGGRPDWRPAAQSGCCCCCSADWSPSEGHTHTPVSSRRSRFTARSESLITGCSWTADTGIWVATGGREVRKTCGREPGRQKTNGNILTLMRHTWSTHTNQGHVTGRGQKGERCWGRWGCRRPVTALEWHTWLCPQDTSCDPQLWMRRTTKRRRQWRQEDWLQRRREEPIRTAKGCKYNRLVVKRWSHSDLRRWKSKLTQSSETNPCSGTALTCGGGGAVGVWSDLIGGRLLAAGLNLEGLELLRNSTSCRTHRLLQTRISSRQSKGSTFVRCAAATKRTGKKRL